VTYDVSFSLVWADGSTALNKNEAYAFASCTDCRTVAVAFQVVLVAGQVDVVVPQNLSGALNYGCVRCVTQALATQLVVSVPGALTDAQNAQLAAVWKELQAFGTHIQDVPLAELRSRLSEYEARILDVVRPAATGASESAGSATPTSSATGTGTAGFSDAPASTGGASATKAGASGGTTPSEAPATTEAPPTSAGPASPTAESTASASASG
jgi:putative peptide zinc metalloprotease protein